MGIAHYVAGSVKNLDVKNVRIIDNKGNVLFFDDYDTPGVNMDEQQERKLLLKEKLKEKLFQY